MPVEITWPIFVGIIHPNIGAWLTALIIRNNMKPWYESLKKPTWTPPNWVFGPIWTVLYCSMGYASYLVYRDGNGFDYAALPLSIYGVNLVLNWSWTPLFFGAHNIKLALCEIVLLWGSTVVLGTSFYQVNRLAGYLILPYLAWNTFAIALNYAFYRDNPVVKSIADKKQLIES